MAAVELAALRRLRFSDAHSRGRRYPEPPHAYRTEFQRDRDRIIHTGAFRRLENKTQVFTPGLSDHFRNRLTHTIEVAQVSRTVAGALGLAEDLTEALALAHDIGHPPFAHSGEQELNRQMGRFGDSFNHNLHALRIVESFERRYARFPGLNLTFEVREGIVKHSRDIASGEDPLLGEYLPGLHPLIEAQLIDPADELAYNTADLDDAHSAGLLGLEAISKGVPKFGELLEQVDAWFPGARGRIRFHETLRMLFDWLVTGLIEGTHRAATRAGVENAEQVRHYRERLACFTPETQTVSRRLKRFLLAEVYTSAPLVAERKRSSAMIARLFQFYLDHPDRMPAPYSGQVRRVPVHRVVCDYIAGMTDPFFERTYQRLVT